MEDDTMNSHTENHAPEIAVIAYLVIGLLFGLFAAGVTLFFTHSVFMAMVALIFGASGGATVLILYMMMTARSE